MSFSSLFHPAQQNEGDERQCAEESKRRIEAQSAAEEACELFFWRVAQSRCRTHYSMRTAVKLADGISGNRRSLQKE